MGTFLTEAAWKMRWRTSRQTGLICPKKRRWRRSALLFEAFFERTAEFDSDCRRFAAAGTFYPIEKYGFCRCNRSFTAGYIDDGVYCHRHADNEQSL